LAHFQEATTVIELHRPEDDHVVAVEVNVRFKGGPVFLDDSKAEAMSEQIAGLTDGLGACELSLDFSNVGYIGSTLLGLLLRLHKRLAATGGHLQLRNLKPHIYEVFQVTRLSTVLDVLPAPSAGRNGPSLGR
jgi:anti-sigma B factor antagonist